jgi:hypothetical protein
VRKITRLFVLPPEPLLELKNWLRRKPQRSLPKSAMHGMMSREGTQETDLALLFMRGRSAVGLSSNGLACIWLAEGVLLI